MAPVYAVGLSKSDAWFRQTAYSLETPHLVPAAAGDSVRLVVRMSNHRDEAIAGQLKLALPKGWTARRRHPGPGTPGRRGDQGRRACLHGRLSASRSASRT